MSKIPNVAEAEIVVDRVPQFRGWQIRTKDQLPGTGTVVTDHWLRAFGFGQPTKTNIDRIIEAMAASLRGYAPDVADLDVSAKKYGDPFSEKGAADGIEIGEGLRGIF